MPRKESNTTIYLTILIVFIAFFIGTLLHDPLLHWMLIKFNGWEFASYSASIGTGSTDALVSQIQITKTSTFDYWLYFMFPSLFIFMVSFAVALFRPDKLLLIMFDVLMLLNYASILPGINGSDANNAIKFLVTRGYNESTAYFMHYIILIVMIVIYALYRYVGTEDNPKDAMYRGFNIWK